MLAPGLPSLGARIRHYRRQCGLTQRALERLCDLDHPCLTRIEADVRQPRVDVVARIAQALGLCPAQLLPCPHPPSPEHVLCRGTSV